MWYRLDAGTALVLDDRCRPKSCSLKKWKVRCNEEARVIVKMAREAALRRGEKRRANPHELGLAGQVTKRMRWMPWRPQATKDVAACEKLRGAGKQALIRRSLNGETHPRGYPDLNP